MTVLTVLLAMCALFLARWWQVRPQQPGQFGAEFQQLRLGKVLGVAAALAIGASLLTDRPLVDDLGRLFMGALMVVGLAAAHRFKAEGRLNAGLAVGDLFAAGRGGAGDGRRAGRLGIRGQLVAFARAAQSA